MDNVEQRLTRCFQVVFPELSETEVRTADLMSVAAWDSLATVTLINVVEEEFGIQIEVDDIDDFVSFPLFLRYLQKVAS